LAASWKECEGPLKGAASSLEVFGLLDRNFAGKSWIIRICVTKGERYTYVDFATPCGSHETNNICMTFEVKYI